MNGNGVIRSGYPFGWGAYESTLVRGDGMYVFDQNGKRYLDLCSGHLEYAAGLFRATDQGGGEQADGAA